MRQRTHGIHIRVTQQEKSTIEHHAKRCGLTVSEYLRQLMSGREPRDVSQILERGDDDGNNQDMAHPR